MPTTYYEQNFGRKNRGKWQRTCVTIFFFAACALACKPCAAQIAQRYELARTYEQNGDIEQAAHIYRELYASDPANEVYFSDVERTFLALKRYGALDTIIAARIAARGADLSLYAVLGAVKFHEGDRYAASAAWDSAIAAAGANTAAYQYIASLMTGAQAYEAAAQCYERGRAALRDANAFANELAYLYTMLLDYTHATQEYVGLILARRMPLAFAESRMGLFTTTGAGDSAAIAVVRNAAREHSGAIDLQYLLAWLLMEKKSYADALKTYKTIDDLRRAGGRDMLDFAARALDDGAYAVSLEAYEDARTRAATDALRAEAEFGAAQARQAAWKAAAPDSAALAAAVANAFDGVAQRFPHTLWADSALLRSAEIRFDPLFDLQTAAARVTALLASRSRIAQSGRIDILMGKIYVAENQLDSAAQSFAAAERSFGAAADVVQEARYAQGELLFFKEKFDSAQVVLRACAAHPNAAFTNEAIELSQVIQENNDSGAAAEALKRYARAALLGRQKKFGDAVALLESVGNDGSAPALADRALIALGADLTNIRQYSQALEAYHSLLDRFPESILRDRAQIRIAAIYDKYLRDIPAAIRAYEELLADYPNSIFADQARARILALRRES